MNTYFAAIRGAMIEGKNDKWAMFHPVWAGKSFLAYYQPHYIDCSIMKACTRNRQIQTNSYFSILNNHGENK